MEFIVPTLVIIATIIITRYIIKRNRDEYWRNILKQLPIPLYWDAEPKCPYCGETQEVAVGLEQDEQITWTICSKCEKTFYIKPKFTLTHEIVQNEGENIETA